MRGTRRNNPHGADSGSPRNLENEMALELNFWESDGPKGESIHHTLRLAKKADADAIVKAHTSSLSCIQQSDSIVRITLDRSDKQSPISRNLWLRPGYKDPFAE